MIQVNYDYDYKTYDANGFTVEDNGSLRVYKGMHILAIYAKDSWDSVEEIDSGLGQAKNPNLDPTTPVGICNCNGGYHLIHADPFQHQYS